MMTVWMGMGLWLTAAAERPNILLLIGDNWSHPHAAALGDPAVRTPTFDRLTREGIVFTHAFCPVPSCSPTRSCIVTGRAAHQLEHAASLWSIFPGKWRLFTDELAKAGYHVGHTGKGWSPGVFADHGRTVNPAGPVFKSFDEFMQKRQPDQPFFFWHGSVHTALHQWRKTTTGKEAGIDPAKVVVPGYLPDAPEVRDEIADYLACAQLMDAAFGEAIDLVQKQGLLDNTVVIYTSDNGWQMPRGLANCHDSGTRVPFVVRWGNKLQSGRRAEEFISLTDLAPTFLELAGIMPWPEMTGRSFADVLQNKPSATPRDHVFVERERHANVRVGNGSYPIRGVRNRQFLYLMNLRPDRWPAGDPTLWYAVGPFGDIDHTRTKDFIYDHRAETAIKPYFERCFLQRPAEELYDLTKDPDQIHNVAADPAYATAKQQLRQKVEDWMKATADPRVDPKVDPWDEYPYLGGKFDPNRKRR